VSDSNAKEDSVAVPESSTLQLVLATGAFAVCFAVFGTMAGMMTTLTDRFHMSEFQVGLALAMPVLFGSLGRIPLGILTDRHGGRAVFLGVLAFAIIPAALMPLAQNVTQLLICGFFLGVPLAVFSVGVGFVSGWYPPGRQGAALGIYGAGNVGQSLSLMSAPFVVKYFGYAWGFWGCAILAFIWLVLMALLAKNAPVRGPKRALSDYLKPLAQPMSWGLSLYYFLTFGGFLAMAQYLPKFLTLDFQLSKQDAGLRAAGFVLLATAARPVGGWLADKHGGIRILVLAFPLTAVCAIMMACPVMITFTAGALGMGLAIGLGNGAVFKLVPQYFPKSVGSVTGLVGAAGGLGGFFPPLVLGVLKQTTGSFAWGFALLAVFALVCMGVLLMSGRRGTIRPSGATPG